MKNATKHADDLKSLLKKLLKEGKPEPLQPMEPLRALVRAALAYDVPESRADEAMKVVDREFVDLNELRVATELELQELIGTRYPDIEQRSMLLTTWLNAIFEKEHTLNLERLKTVSKKDVRQFLRDLPQMTPFADAYVMLFGFGGGGIPVDQSTLDYLKAEKLVEDESSAEEVQKFLENQLKGDECYEFYACIRRAVFSDKRAPAGAKAKG